MHALTGNKKACYTKLLISQLLWIQAKHKIVLLIPVIQGCLPPNVRSKGVILKPYKLFN